MADYRIKQFCVQSLFVFTLLSSQYTFAGCFPVPAFWGFAIACTADREGKGLAFTCGPEDVDLKQKDGTSECRVTGMCVHSIPIKDSYGGDFGGPVEKTYFFSAKTVASIFNPITPNNTQESITIYKDAKRTDKLGKINAKYTCQENPFVDIGASCKTEAFASTTPREPIWNDRQPFAKGLCGSPNTGTSKQQLKTAKPKTYIGIWRSGSDPYYLWRAKGWSEFVNKWKQLSSVGLRLEDIETFSSGSDVYFTGVWRKGNDGHYLWRSKDWKTFTNKWQELGKKNLRLSRIESYAVGGSRYYVGVWRSGKDGYYLWNTGDWNKFTSKWSELGKKNLRLVDIETYTKGKRTQYIGVWRAGKDGYILWNTNSWKKFVGKWKELGPKKLRLVDIDVSGKGNSTQYIGVWRSGSDGYTLWRAGSWGKLVSKWKEFGKKDLRLVSLLIN